MNTLLASDWPTWLSPWEFTASDWAGLTFLFVALAALVAARQAREARLLRIEQARPYVALDLDAAGTLLELRVKNVGATMALNVQFAFDPPLSSTYDDKSGRGPLSELHMFKHGIPSMIPGKEMTLFFDQFIERTEAGLPNRYDVEISYSGVGGHRWHERTVLDVEVYRGTGGVTRHTIHDVHARLKEISETLRKKQGGVG